MFVSIKNTKISSDLIFEIFISLLIMKTAHRTNIHNVIFLQLRQEKKVKKTRQKNPETKQTWIQSCVPDCRTPLAHRCSTSVLMYRTGDTSSTAKLKTSIAAVPQGQTLSTLKKLTCLDLLGVW